MSGKPKMTGWGGARQGAGRPSYMLTENKIKKWEREIRKRAKEEGKTLIGTLLDIAYAKVDGKVSVRDRIAAVETIWKFTTPKSSEQNINVHHSRGPAIYLPAKKEDPALKLVTGGKGK
jgi:hypothetical protein